MKNVTAQIGVLTSDDCAASPFSCGLDMLEFLPKYLVLLLQASDTVAPLLFCAHIGIINLQNV